MEKLLLFSHNGFSDENANGITMKNLLCAWKPPEKAVFYCDVQAPDFSAADTHFRVTDVEMVKAFLGKKPRAIFDRAPEPVREGERGEKKSPKKIPLWLKKQKYNFALKWLREYLRQISPWGHKAFRRWLKEVDPDVLFYMVGESIFLDKLVMKACKKTGKPLVLYNGEAYRIIDLQKRHGLERAYYKKTEKLYRALEKEACLVLYNCPMLQRDYEARYAPTAPGMVTYNSAHCGTAPYVPKESLTITYFGNLGVGRSDSLLRVGDILGELSPDLRLDIYGTALPEDEARFRAHKNIAYHGFVSAESLQQIIERSDILLHVESFDPDITQRLKYAFSTKIAQCLCAGRCFVSFAPEETASSRYLLSLDGVAVAKNEQELKELLTKLTSQPALRRSYAQKALEWGRKNHDKERTSQALRQRLQSIRKDLMP